jgi:predicted  nucleic acid-binding Zn-ribbon protein
MSKSKEKHSCAHCGQRFAKISEHMTHVLQAHDTGQRGRGQRLGRSISCWRCGTVDLYPSGEDNWYYCECGWELPRNWVDGQLTREEEETK